jgi:hypothetical protein
VRRDLTPADLGDLLEIRGIAEVRLLPYGTTIRRIGRRYIGPAADRMWAHDDNSGSS